MNKKKVLITGGHVTPALAVIDELVKNHDCEIVFVGRRYVNDQEVTDSFEYQQVIKRKILFIHLETGRFTRIISLQSIKEIFKIPIGFLSAFKIIYSVKPDVILSFGGYLAVPIVIIGKLFGTRIITHEQTIQPGLANRLISRFADVVFLSFAQSQKYFRSNTVVTGNALRQSIFQNNKKFTVPTNKPCIYITGGSLGAHSINIHIEHILQQLLEKLVVIHQTGNVVEFDDYKRLHALWLSLSPQLQKSYIIKTHFGDREIGDVYSAAELVVGRAGANTFFELVALGKPAIFIPLPWSAHDEQLKHAQLFVQHKAGLIFDQSHDSQELLTLINELHKNINEYHLHVGSLAKYHKPNAEKVIISKLFEK